MFCRKARFSFVTVSMKNKYIDYTLVQYIVGKCFVEKHFYIHVLYLEM